MASNDAADWATLSDNGTLPALDVRATFKPEDGAIIYAEYPNIHARPTLVKPNTGGAAGSFKPGTDQRIYTLYEAKPVS